MISRPVIIAFAMLTLLPLPLAAASDAQDAALVTLEIHSDGERVFSPQMLVRLGQMAEMRIESPAGEGHRIVLSVTRDGDIFHMRSIYMTKHEKNPWVVIAEPAISIRDATEGSMALIGGDHELRFDVEIGGGTFADLRARVFPDAVTEPAT